MVIHAEQVSKTYSLTRAPARRLVEHLFGLTPINQKTALSPLSFTLKKGQSIGLIGKNGAGKSTLLQIAAGVLGPTSGTLKCSGRSAALLELGAGLLPDLTGRENIQFAGPLWGLTPIEVERHLPSIIEFSELGGAIDAPLRTYSSGMVVRLAFSMATAAQPSLLIIDEALAVGDGQFAQKSFDRIMQLKKEGTSLLFCSHALYQVEMLCDQALWLHEGSSMAFGPSGLVCRQYQQFLDFGATPKREMQAPEVLATHDNGYPTTASAIRSIQLLKNGDVVGTTQPSVTKFTSRIDDLGIDVSIGNPGQSGKTVHVALLIKDDANRVVSSLSTHNDGFILKPSEDAAHTAKLTVTFKKLQLLKGIYTIDVILMCDQAIRFIETVTNAVTFEVIQTDKEIGVVSLPHAWSQH